MAKLATQYNDAGGLLPIVRSFTLYEDPSNIKVAIPSRTGPLTYNYLMHNNLVLGASNKDSLDGLGNGGTSCESDEMRFVEMNGSPHEITNLDSSLLSISPDGSAPDDGTYLVLMKSCY